MGECLICDPQIIFPIFFSQLYSLYRLVDLVVYFLLLFLRRLIGPITKHKLFSDVGAVILELASNTCCLKHSMFTIPDDSVRQCVHIIKTSITLFKNHSLVWIIDKIVIKFVSINYYVMSSIMFVYLKIQKNVYTLYSII